ncbi:hypothetical protein DENSPDRAFT_830804 [Dentipellis sp. KUC8613]|nr:hypothetical protein DENSPDRAFT_830804 [Dentipellis sp. KUC8613]
MTGPARLPAVRLPSVLSNGGDGEAPNKDGVVVELPPSNKFSIAWPAEPPPTMPSQVLGDRSTSLSSSDTDSGLSEPELSQGEGTSRAEVRKKNERRKTVPEDADADESDFTPTNRLYTEQNPMDQAMPPPALPRLSRAFSVPLPSQIGFLKNPRRAVSPEWQADSSPPPVQLAPEFSHFNELSLELADSVQMVIQTLLQLSPPQVLDPAKEQFSACSLSIPTPSITAMFTAMKNLNYMSANMAAFSLSKSSEHLSDSPPVPDAVPASAPEPSANSHDFDIGETLQSVGDALSGVAAEAGVDLVLFHGDVGMKHVAVKGVESGISYTLSHIIRQIITTARRGDAVEVGLFIVAPALNSNDSTVLDSTEVLDATDPESLHASPDPDKPLRCTFNITHIYGHSDSPSAPESSDPPTTREEPALQTRILDGLLRHINASFISDVSLEHPGRSCQLTLVLDRGSPAVVNPAVVVPEDDPVLNAFPSIHISGEPTLEELAEFTTSLKGKKVSLYASSKGHFARHLTSYLTAWGLDVSHVSADSDVEGSPERQETASAAQGTKPTPIINDVSFGNGSVLETLPEQVGGPGPNGSGSPQVAQQSPSLPSFILIDDDVAVLRERLRKLREQQYPLHLGARKRPSLSSQHRPRSSPQVTRAIGLGTSASVQVTNRYTPVIIHFTSLSNYKLVKGILQSTLAPNGSTSMRLPEVIVIPKPAGPRRVLTALHTAATRPIVDPFFTPIATSPCSPGLYPSQSYFGQNLSPKSPLHRPPGSPRSGSERPMRSPKDHEGVSLAPPSPLGLSEGMDYFSEAAAKLGTSPSSGLVIQSPDGQPAGIFFHPRARASRMGASGVNMERDRGQFFGFPGPERTLSRQQTEETIRTRNAVAFRSQNVGASTAKRSPRPSVSVDISSPDDVSDSAVQPSRKPVQLSPVEYSEPLSAQSANSPLPSDSPADKGRPSRAPIIRKNSPAAALRKVTSPPTTPRGAAGPASRRGSHKRPSVDGGQPPASSSAAQKKAKAPSEANIIPPISVLIVDDNPINQTILSTFMKKKKITFDVAKNGEEAVQKWKSGKFHLILMDIQMPVMDGIAATKEIRRIEKINASQGYPTTPQSEGQRTPSDAASTDTRMSASPYKSSVIIVALTASSLQSDRVAALAAGCNDFLTKPVSLSWLNSKIIEWGSIKALQMWADIRPDAVKSMSSGQTAQAQDIARRLHVPEGRASPVGSPSRSDSLPRTPLSAPHAAAGVSPTSLYSKQTTTTLALSADPSLASADVESADATPTQKAPTKASPPPSETGDQPVPEPGPSSTPTAEGTASKPSLIADVPLADERADVSTTGNPPPAEENHKEERRPEQAEAPDEVITARADRGEVVTDAPP